MKDAEGNFMAFGGNLVNVQCFNSSTKQYIFQGNYKRVVILFNGTVPSDVNCSLNDIEIPYSNWIQVTKTNYNGMALTYAILNDVKENDVLKWYGNGTGSDYIGAMAIF